MSSLPLEVSRVEAESHTGIAAVTGTGAQPLRACIKSMMDNYFSDLDGHEPGNLYEMVVREVERPLLETVMVHTRGNQSKAAKLLGINRGTLRKKLKIHNLD